jgi:hypothetical protein
VAGTSGYSLEVFAQLAATGTFFAVSFVLAGFTGILLLATGIAAAIMRERISTFSKRFKGWNA